MAFLKVLYVVLFLYSASFSVIGRLENHSILKKRAQASRTEAAYNNEEDQAVRNAALLVAAVRRRTGKNTGQFGYVYLQPTETTGVYLIPTFVATALNGEDGSLPPYTTPWPTNFNTNFRFCFVDYEMPKETNYGHPEYLLLNDKGLEKMARNMEECPKYVILYSTNLPCYKPQNPDPIENPRCAELTLRKKDAFHEVCPDATFYLYTDKETAVNLPDKQKMEFLINSGIVWLHPDMYNVKALAYP